MRLNFTMFFGLVLGTILLLGAFHAGPVGISPLVSPAAAVSTEPNAVSVGSGSAASTSLSISHSANALVMVFVSAGTTISAITIGGVSPSALMSYSNGPPAVYVWYRFISAAGTETVSVTFAVVTVFRVTAVSFLGYASADANTFESASIGTWCRSTTSCSVTVGAGTAGRMVIGVLAGQSPYTSACPTSYTFGSGQSAIQYGCNPDCGTANFLGVTFQNTANQVTMSLAVNQAYNWGPEAFAIKTSVITFSTDTTVPSGTIGSDASGTILTVNGVAYTYSNVGGTTTQSLSASSVTYAFTQTIPSTIPGKQYVWTSTTGTAGQTAMQGTFIPAATGTIIGHYKTQYYLEVDGATTPYLLFPLEEGSGSTIRDVSGAYQGTIPSGVSWVAGQQAGTYALLFGGSNHIEVMADVPEYDFIIEIRFRTTAATTGIFSVLSGANGGGGHDRHVYVSDGAVCFRVWQGGGWCTSKIVNDGNWHTVILTVRSGIGQFAYVDGSLVGTYPYDHSDFNWQDRIGIGWSNDGGGNFNGAIDMVAIYKIQTGSGEGWYDSGASASFSISTTTISMGAGRQLSFKGWELDYTGTGISGSVTMNGAKVVKARFGGQYQLTYSVNPTSGGSISLNPTDPGSGWYNLGTSVTVTANPGVSYVFVSWSDGGAQIHSITMNQATTLTANFAHPVDHFTFETIPSPQTAGSSFTLTITAVDRGVLKAAHSRLCEM